MPEKAIDRHQSKRDLILSVALDIFAEKGYQKTTIGEIALAAGISVGSLYDYFKDKEDLFFSVTDELMRHFMEQVNLHLEGIHGAFNKLRKFVWYYIYSLEQSPRESRMLMLEQRNMKAFFNGSGYAYLRAGVGRLLEIIEEGQQEGSIRPDIDKYLARQLVMGIVENMTTRWLLHDCSYSISNRSDEVTDLIINALRKPG